MATITFAELAAEVAAHHAREAAERTPLARACRAMDTLRDALALMPDDERGEVREMIAELVGEG